MTSHVRSVDPAREFGGTVLILAPHMDDEVLACGGTVARLPQPALVHVAYATDGAGSPVPPAPWLGRPDPGLPALRRREAAEAMAELGVPEGNLHFLDLPDGGLARLGGRLADALRGLAARIVPDHVFAPFRFDRHPDHLAVGRAARAVFTDGAQGRRGEGRERGLRPRLLEYFVYWRWRLLPGGDVRAYLGPEGLVRVEVPPVAAALKRRALERFRTQTRRFFPWQSRPNLTEEFLDAASRDDEVFHAYDPTRPGAAVFRRGAAWIRAVHRVELPVKREKDRLIAIARALGRRP